MDNTKDINIRDIIYISKMKNRNINKNKIIKAYKYAKEKHKNQKRKSGEPYIIHPLNVAYILAKLGLDTETICAALLHDVVEDTDSTYNDIKELFGTDIANIVEGVTKLSILFKTTEKTKAENYKKMFIAMEKDIRVIILKLADRLHNIMTLEHLKRDRQIAISKETIELYAPIANKLGMYDMKVKLEDGAFKYLYPEEYINIKDRVNKKITSNNELLKKTKYKIELELKKQRIFPNVMIDTKSLYCVYKNITENNINFDETKDLFRIKIITNRKQDCYKILGIINKMYFFLPGSFKDFIAIPKNNKYQAIEEIVLGENGIIFELEICTFIMDKIDKYGITAYFPYFNYYGEKEEKVLVKRLHTMLDDATPKLNYPNFSHSCNKFILPIMPQYHTTLLPDSQLNSENRIDFLGREPHRYALQKVYISWASTNGAKPGDLILFYRMGAHGENKKYKSVVSTIAIVDEIIENIRSEDELLSLCQNRSVFSVDELKEFWSKHRYNLKILKFIFVKSLTKRLTLGYLWEHDIIAAPGGPRPFTAITDAQFDMIVQDSETEIDYVE